MSASVCPDRIETIEMAPTFRRSGSPSAGALVGMPAERSPVIERIPVTQKYLAAVISTGFEVDHPGWARARPYFEESLRDSVAALVHTFASKYATSCDDEIEDLEQECFRRIFMKLHLYKPLKGAFTTWTSRVCHSVLNGKYRKSKRWKGRVVLSEPAIIERVVDASEEGDRCDRFDMREALRELFGLHPEFRGFLTALFDGDPEEDDYEPPGKISVMGACRISGAPYERAYPFYLKVVRPFFRERFAGDER